MNSFIEFQNNCSSNVSDNPYKNSFLFAVIDLYFFHFKLLQNNNEDYPN